MSKRHQSSRRRSYGRRQHELHEREAQQRNGSVIEDGDLDGYGDSRNESVAFPDPRGARLRFAIGD